MAMMICKPNRKWWHWLIWVSLWLFVGCSITYTLLSQSEYLQVFTSHEENDWPMRKNNSFYDNVCVSKALLTGQHISQPHPHATSGHVYVTQDFTSNMRSQMSFKQAPLLLTLKRTSSGRFGNLLFMYASLVGIARTLKREPFIFPGSALDMAFRLRHLAEIPHSEKWHTVTETSYGAYDKGLIEKLFRKRFNYINVTIDGYYQSWKYFRDISHEIRAEFVFKDSILQQRAAILQAVLPVSRKDVVLIGVHVRRVDLNLTKHLNLGYTTPKMSYYLKAFQYMRRKFYNQTVMFLIASDDLPWCKEHLAGNDVILMPLASHVIHLSLLASCDHVIFSTGTFGWWGAWLADGYVVYYKNYPANGSELAAGFSRNDYFPEIWTGLSD